VLYHVVPREGARTNLAVHFDAGGVVTALDPPSSVPLPSTPIWRIPRGTRADAGHPATVVQTLEDTPFYARSVVASRLHGDKVTAVHESLSLDRFRCRWVQMLLPFRMPRVRS
jgi:carotenoid 1,2-hydratase